MFWKNGCLLDYNKETNEYIKYSDHHINNFKNNIINYLGGEPDVIYAKNYLAPITSKQLFPKSKIYYLVSGVYYTSMLNTVYNEVTSAQKVLNNFENYRKKINACVKLASFINMKQEIYTLNVVDGIVYNSKLTNDLINLYYKDYIKEDKIIKIINTSLLNQ